jgi:hypothetical protein
MIIWCRLDRGFVFGLRGLAMLTLVLLSSAPVHPREEMSRAAGAVGPEQAGPVPVEHRDGGDRRERRHASHCSTKAQFLHSFEDSITENGAYHLQGAGPDRITLIDAPVRHGSRAIRFITSGRDTRIHGSGAWERSELRMDTRLSDGDEGRENWWAHSTYFPDDFQFPQRYMPWKASVFVQWHDSRDTGPQPNLVGEVVYEAGRSPGLVMRFRVTHAGGDYRRYAFFRGPPERNVWYDFVYHLRWSSGNDGFARIWARRADDPRGHLVMDYHGPTLYPGNGVYFKIGTYHPQYSDAPGSVIHDCVAKGATGDEIRWFPLEGLD